MQFELSPITIIILIAIVFSSEIAVVVWRNRSSSPAALPLFILSLLIIIWLLMHYLCLSSLNLSTMILMAKIQYIGISFIPPALIIFALTYYYQRNVIKPRYLILLGLISLITLILVWTNELHGLIWSEYSITRESSITLSNIKHGAWFWVHWTYANLSLLVTSLFLLQKVRTLINENRQQTILIILAVLAPWIGNLIYILKISPVKGLDFTPLSFSVSFILLWISIFKLRLLEVLPIVKSAIIDGMNDGVIVVDRLNRIIYSNEAVQNIANFDKKQWYGKKIDEINDLAFFKFDDGSTQISLDNKGENQSYSISISFSHDKKGNQVGRIITFHEITGIKKMEKELKQSLLEKEKIAQDLQEEMKRRIEYTRALVHELKTPLTPILSTSELLLDTVESEAVLKGLKNINKGAKSLNKRIDELLDLARGELGLLKFNYIPFNLNNIMQSVYDEFCPFAATEGISLVLKLDKDIPMLLIDSDRIKQVIENLLTNALKWTLKDGTVIMTTESDSQHVLVKIIDTGPGIAEERIEHIFNPYSRQEEDRQHFSGLGLGLSLCKNIIELHMGKIWVVNNPDRGSTFIFSLPESLKIKQHKH